MKIALLEVSHWHFPLYQKALQDSDIDIVAVSDGDHEVRAKVSAVFGCPSFTSYIDLLNECADLDFVFAFGVHAQMPDIAKAIMRRSLPFSIEKPCGRTSVDVHKLSQISTTSNGFVSIPFVYRVSDLAREIKKRMDCELPIHYCVRNIAGDPFRYEVAGVPWMLDRTQAGGGCAINLAVHFVDLFRYLTGSDIIQSSGSIRNIAYDVAVEDYACIQMESLSNSIGTVEVGYTYPQSNTSKREFYLSIGGASEYIVTSKSGIVVMDRSGDKCQPDVHVELDTDTYYYTYVQDTLRRYRDGEKPIAGLDDLFEVMKVIDRLYR